MYYFYLENDLLFSSPESGQQPDIYFRLFIFRSQRDSLQSALSFTFGPQAQDLQVTFRSFNWKLETRTGLDVCPWCGVHRTSEENQNKSDA